MLATRGLDALDNYYTQFLPALVNCAAIPLLLGARILFADWISAVVIVLTVPLVPLFMVLIGRYTEDRVREAQSALARLSGHMLELAKGLPVLVGLGRAAAQRRALEDMSEEYRSRTMGTLRTAFLSALALELIATISVAVVAVFIGVRLVHGDMALEAGLLALILAPDCYLPLRELGTAHHASDEGRAALAETTAVLSDPGATPLNPAPAPGPAAGPPAVSVDGLTVRFGGRTDAAVGPLSFTAPAGRITALDGASGAGKSTVLGVLAGTIGTGREPSCPDASEDLRRRRSHGCHSTPSWWPPRCWTRSACILAFPPMDRTPPRPGLQPVLRPALRLPYCRQPYCRHSCRCSGQCGRRCGRAAVPRGRGRGAPGCQAPGRAEPGGAEPGGAGPRTGTDRSRRQRTAPGRTHRPPGPGIGHVVNRALAGLRGHVTVLLVAHDPQTRELADTLVAVVPRGGGHHGIEHPDPVPPFSASAGGDADVAAAAIRPPSVVGAPTASPSATPGASPSSGRPDAGGSTAPSAGSMESVGSAGPVTSQLRRLLAPVAGKFAAAGAVGTLAALFAVALAGLSGWLIIRASEQPPILLLAHSDRRRAVLRRRPGGPQVRRTAAAP